MWDENVTGVLNPARRGGGAIQLVASQNAPMQRGRERGKIPRISTRAQPRLPGRCVSSSVLRVALQEPKHAEQDRDKCRPEHSLLQTAASAFPRPCAGSVMILSAAGRSRLKAALRRYG